MNESIDDFDPNDPKWTNRLGIAKPNMCKKCKDKGFDIGFHIEGRNIFYCCDKCAIKHGLKSLNAEMYGQ